MRKTLQEREKAAVTFRPIDHAQSKFLGDPIIQPGELEVAFEMTIFMTGRTVHQAHQALYRMFRSPSYQGSLGEGIYQVRDAEGNVFVVDGDEMYEDGSDFTTPKY